MKTSSIDLSTNHTLRFFSLIPGHFRQIDLRPSPHQDLSELSPLLERGYGVIPVASDCRFATAISTTTAQVFVFCHHELAAILAVAWCASSDARSVWAWINSVGLACELPSPWDGHMPPRSPWAAMAILPPIQSVGHIDLLAIHAFAFCVPQAIIHRLASRN